MFQLLGFFYYTIDAPYAFAIAFKNNSNPVGLDAPDQTLERW